MADRHSYFKSEKDEESFRRSSQKTKRLALNALEELCSDSPASCANAQCAPKDDWSFTGEPEDDYRTICKLVKRNADMPSPHLSSLLQMKCRYELELGLTERAALSLLSSHGTVVFHRSTVQVDKKIMRDVLRTGSRSDLFDSDEKLVDIGDLTNSIMDMQVKSIGQSDKVKGLISQLPPSWKVIQLSVMLTKNNYFRVESKTKAPEENFPLYVTTFRCADLDESLAVHVVDALERNERPSLLKELRDLVLTHKQIYRVRREKEVYVRARQDVQDRMETFLTSVENKWLGPLKTLFLGVPKDENRVSLITEAIRQVTAKLKMPRTQPNGLLFSLFDGAAYLDEESLFNGMCKITKTKSKVKELFKAAAEFGRQHPSTANTPRHPVSLILDSDVQEIPWETLPCLRNQPIARVPSIFFLCALYQSHMGNGSSVIRTGVRNENIFYVLNPNKDLPKTEERLAQPFEQLNLGPGKVGTWPSGDEFRTVLSRKDAFMYCGHGSIMKTITSAEIEKLEIRALPLLFGCNSGKLESLGRYFEPTGTVNSYIIATAPDILGFLWSVTDLDLDKWTVGFLHAWLALEEDFVQTVARQRSKFTHIMNSAALVVYGLPSFKEN